jgi:Uma2 family endonuclease
MATRLASVHRFTVDEYERMAEVGIIPSRPVELIDGQVVVGGRPWRFTVRDYHRLAETGILTEDQRVELIEGEIVDMSPIGSHHAGSVKRIVGFLRERLGREVVLSVQDPVHLDDDLEPQPDVMLLRPRDDYYSASHPTSTEVLLLIEVADSSTAYDRTEKADLYAEHGVSEYWMVDLTKDAVLVHTSPSPLGYLSVETKRREDTWSAAAISALAVRGEDLLG